MADELLPLETYARILAHLVGQRDAPLEAVLRSHEASAAQFAAADAHYCEQLSLSFRKRKGALAMTFASAFAEARKARGLDGAAPDPLPPSHATPQPDARSKPSYLSQAAPPAPPSIALVPAFPTSPSPPSQIPPASQGRPPPGNTVALPVHGVISRILPFQGPPAPAPVPPKPVPPAPETARTPSFPKEITGNLTLAHFAALQVELSRQPPDQNAVLRRYGLSSAEDLRYVTAAFQAHMQAEPNIRTQFDAMVARMLAASSSRGTDGAP